MPLEAHGRQFAAPFGPGVGVSGGGEIELGFSTDKAGRAYGECMGWW